ncbi:MAG: hypothetical protein QW354_00755 [Desulfurococcaceae archaeon]
MRKLFIILLMFLIIVSQIPFISAQTMGNWILEEVSFRSNTGGNVYPGSNNAVLTIVVRYTGLSGNIVIHPVACIELPSGFETIGTKCSGARNLNNEYLPNATTGEILKFEFRLNVNKETKPGSYIAVIRISFLTGNIYYQDYLSISLYVAPYPPLMVNIEEVYITPYSYPGSCPVSANVRIRNKGETTITSMRLTLRSSPNIITPNTVNVTITQSLRSGEYAIVSFPNICIDPTTLPGSYMAELLITASLMTDDGVSYDDRVETYLAFNVEQAPAIKISLLDYSLTSNIPLPGLNNTGIRMIIQSNEPGLIRLTHSQVELKGATSLNGSSIFVVENEINMNYLDVAELVFRGLVIHDNASYIVVNVTLHGIVQRYNSEYPAHINMLLLVPLRDDELDLRVERVEWGNVYAYPNSTGNTLVISVLNMEMASITASLISLKLPPDVFYPSDIVVYNVIIQGLSITQVVFQGISIGESAKPGIYEAELTIYGFIQCNDGSTRYLKFEKKISVIIHSVDALMTWKPSFNLVSAFWGEGTPQYIYPGNPRAGLTLTIQNIGLYIASDVVITLIPDDESIKPLSNSVVCGSINPGGICQAMFYLDLTNADPGSKQFTLSLTYSLNQLGTRSRFYQLINFTLFLPEFKAGEGIEIASSGWLNNNPVYPRTKGAVYTITLVNLEPYPVYSMWVTLDLPSCMKIREGGSSSTYIAGPIASLQTTSTSFTLDITCQPGIYRGVVKIDYYVQYYGGGYRKYVEKPVEMVISNDENSIEVISAGWIGGLPTLPIKGANYMVVIRNKEFPSISNPVMRIRLPKGFVESYSGSNTPNITPAYIIPSMRLQGVPQLQGITPEAILSMATQMTSPQTNNINRGDVMVFVLTLNVENVTTSLYDVPFELVFIDHWGYEYSVNHSFTLNLVGKPPLIVVNPTSPLVVFSNGTAILDLEILNEYEASIYNVYIMLIPMTGIAIPQGNVKYIDEIPSRASLSIRYELLYNPMSVGSIQVSAQTISSMSAVFTVTLIYRDYSGMLNSINSTIAVLVRPFINIEITDLLARYQNNILAVNGLIVNTGLTRARSLVIYVNYGDKYSYTLIGDVDPASQVPFRITLDSQLIGDECEIIVKYMDDYGVEYSISRSVPIRVIQPTTTTPITPGQATIDIYRLTIIMITATFLLAIFFALFIYIRRRQGVRK